MACQDMLSVEGHSATRVLLPEPTEAAPDFAILPVQFQDCLQKLDRFVKFFAGPEDQTDGIHSRDRVGIRIESSFVCLHGVVQIT